MELIEKRPNYLTITANGEFLDKLFAGMTEDAKIELRNACIENFANRQLKAIITTDLKSAIEAIGKKLAQETIGTITKDFYGNIKASLKPELLASISAATRESIEAQIGELIKITVADQIASIETRLSQMIENRIREQIRLKIESRFNAIQSEFINEAVDNKLRSILAGALEKK